MMAHPSTNMALLPAIARGARRSASLPSVPDPRRINVTLDNHTDEILRRAARPGQEAAYVRVAVIEKAARDEYRDELAQLRARLERIEKALNVTP